MIENVIINNLTHSDEYARKVLPFLKEEYFTDDSYKLFYGIIDEFYQKYNKSPSLESLTVSVSEYENIPEQTFRELKEILKSIRKDQKTDYEWLVDKTEAFCQDRALYNAIKEGMKIYSGEHKDLKREAIPDVLTDALSVAFDTHIGHDYLEDFEERYEYYNNPEEKIPFDIDMLNRITKGGVSKKALIVFMASTGVGKTLVMCHLAAAHLMMGYNVLYITMEMAEERISERIDANMLDIRLDSLTSMPKDEYTKKIKKVTSRTKGKLIVKEYPTAGASVTHFRNLIKELKLKRKFVPDVIYVDYLNICMSSRVKIGQSGGSYGYVKSIAEELRGLGVEHNVPVFSATQSNREGYNNSDIDLTNTSESIGLPQTADMFIGLMDDEYLSQRGQLKFKQLKNRWGDINNPKNFLVGIDRSKMRLHDIDNPTEGIQQQ